mmetsp:Transcript_44221/g.117160  ORF Transcript_44221/g.117160 Transcript_44221/m.117160 type:complete len:347 (-) Transcript_44221:151-1191(-)|eukprot:CAMPEP_0194488494 /NCGR_PEP_ID=MMETSP0253-20130528/8398_1 /TAXON_ID=2966 /ORGANISM="Noctiluca scintillans" /LENGTH=346 /DNA_ID=CAMNT_0039328869 /DNA_START=75 /DNA_END=1115 /DNA_ORIENTATION=-
MPNKKRKLDLGKKTKTERMSAATDVASEATMTVDTRDLTSQRREAEALAEEGQAKVEAELQDPDEMTVNEDPYLLADATYIQKDTRWRNKQRTLVFTSRGVTSQHRHLCVDIQKLLPHHKADSKWEKKERFQNINEACELKSCNNAVFFECRKREDLYMWMARVPLGPTFKFQVRNIHTTGEVRLAGNCLLGSRPILHFDKSFSTIPFLKLMRTMFIQVWGTPRNHPKSKPFHDHMMCFYYADHKVWFRHYQIAPEAPDAMNEPERQILTEIGPRFVLDPIRVLAGSFSGQVLYANPYYLTPTGLRIQASKALKKPYERKLKHKVERFGKLKELEMDEDPVEDAFT